MRTLDKNKVTVWVTRKTIGAEQTDANGFYTGDKTVTYSTPVQIRIPLTPANGEIVEQIFGKDASVDMISTSNDVVLDKNDYIFYAQPTGNYDTTYDFMVSSISHSLNTYVYGLKARVK
jgi:hypothetical protein